VRGESASLAEPLLRPGPTDAQRARLSQEEELAHQNADRVVDLALTRAGAIVDRAREDARRIAAEAAAEAAEKEQARLAATWLALRQREGELTTRSLDRVIDLARLLAERLVGQAVASDAGVLASLAREALAEARGARSARIEANPADAAALRAALDSAGLGMGDGLAIDVTGDESLARGSLRVHTELGTVDATLTPRLERLAAALRDALRAP
jgi:flagellar biosynthesis/type III secretory pathway protein FliH